MTEQNIKALIKFPLKSEGSHVYQSDGNCLLFICALAFKTEDDQDDGVAKVKAARFIADSLNSVESLREENEKLREALKAYADENNWRMEGFGDRQLEFIPPRRNVKSGSQIAIEALKLCSEEK